LQIYQSILQVLPTKSLNLLLYLTGNLKTPTDEATTINLPRLRDKSDMCLHGGQKSLFGGDNTKWRESIDITIESLGSKLLQKYCASQIASKDCLVEKRSMFFAIG
jgi:hypothetical protein